MRGNTIAGDLSERLQLPGEALGELSVQTAGRMTLVENHRGLLSFTDESIVVAGARGRRLTVRGTGLFVQAMTKKEMLICGMLQAIEWD